jgi:hypothetical protein
MVVGIATTAKLFFEDMDYDQCRTATLIKNKLPLIHVVLQSLLLDFLPVANDGRWVK